MASDRGMKAAIAVLEQTECEHVERERSLAGCDDCTAALIDRATGLPELEARVAELEMRLRDAQHDQTATRCERDAALRKLDVVREYAQICADEEGDEGVSHAGKTMLRILREIKEKRDG